MFKPTRRCAVHQHLVNVPIEVHHVWPLGMGGPDVADNKVTLCANAHGLVHQYMNKIKQWDGHVPWVIRRTYGKKIRALAELGLRRAETGRM